MKHLFVARMLVACLILSWGATQVSAETQTLKNLHNGSNFLSFYVLPENPTPENVFGDKMAWISKIIGEGKVSYRLPDGSWIGNLETFSRTGAYWVTIEVPPDELSPFDHDIEGIISDPDILYNLHQGENWLSYSNGSNSELNAAIPAAFASLFSKITSEGVATVYLEETGWTGELTGFTPGYGYVFKAEESAEGFNYNCAECDGLSDYAYGCTDPAASNFDEAADLDNKSCTYAIPESWQPVRGGDQAFYILHNPRINGAPLQSGDVIGAFSNGVNVGFGFPEEDYTTVPVFSLGDGDPVTFVVYDTSTGKEYPINPTETLEFEDSGIEILGCLEEGFENSSDVATIGLDNCSNGCDALECNDVGATCGSPEDGCGIPLDCGECAAGTVCDETFSCTECFPTTCEDQGVVCGQIDDGCGNSISCDSCTEGYSCEEEVEECVCSDPSCEEESDVTEETDVVEEEEDSSAMVCDPLCSGVGCNSKCGDDNLVLYVCEAGTWEEAENCASVGQVCQLVYETDEEGNQLPIGSHQCVEPQEPDSTSVEDITADNDSDQTEEEPNPDTVTGEESADEEEQQEETPDESDEENTPEADSDNTELDRSPAVEDGGEDGCGSCAVGNSSTLPPRSGILLLVLSGLVFLRIRRQWMDA